MIMITGWQVEIFYLGDFRNYVVDNLIKLELKIEANLISFSNQHSFFHGRSFIRIIAQTKHIIKKGFCCVFWYASSNCQHEMMHSHIGCICWTFLQCVFSCVFSNCLREMLHNHNGCICLTFLQCVFSCVSLNYLPEMIHSHSGCICLIFLQLVFLSAISKRLHH